MNEKRVCVEDSDHAFKEALADIMQAGLPVPAGTSLSVGSERETREILNYSLTVENPRERLMWNPRKRLFLPGAIARFVWMMAANDRLKDIEFYWGSKVTRYSDDGIVVLGSSYGKRMLNPSPGINQVGSIIERLEEDISTRRAAISIYQPEDSGRKSNDIPCAFGLMFHVRDGVLYSSVLMRSNNCFTLMPYNLFEFSLLAEIVAAQLRVVLGPLHYYAASMHVYEENYEQARELVAGDLPTRAATMPVMPSDPSPIQQVTELVRMEAEARHAAAGFSALNFDEWLAMAETKLNPYWRQFFYLLLLDMAQKRKVDYAIARLGEVIESPWKEYLPIDTFSAGSAVSAEAPSLLQLPARGAITISSSETAMTTRLVSLEQCCEKKSAQLDRSGEAVISFSEFKRLRDSLVGDINAPLLAARGLDELITFDEFDAAFQSLREHDGHR